MSDRFETCGECGHYDEFNATCWLLASPKFGDSIGSDDLACAIYYALEHECYDDDTDLDPIYDT